MTLNIIALTGPKGSGKDTVGKLIKEMYPDYKADTIAFADPIKTKIYHLFDLNPDNNEQYDLFKRTKLTYQLDGHLSHSVEARHVVREIGMLMRSYDTKQFTTYVVDKIKADPNKLWVVTDLRFDDEYIMMKSMGAKIVKIVRPHYDYDGHITERGFDDHLVDTLLMNDGDLGYLKMRVEIVVRSILERTI